MSRLAGATAVSLFVLVQHGHNSAPFRMNFVKQSLTEEFSRHPELRSTLWDCSENEFFFSDSGVMECSTRLCQKLLPTLRTWVAGENAHYAEQRKEGDAAPRLVFSAVGHSFGGVFLRDVIMHVQEDPELMAALQFGTFCSLASPHCGVRYDLDWVRRRVGGLLGKVASTTVAEMLLDSPTLYTTLVDDSHLHALARFECRLLYGNVCRDHVVGLETSTLCFESNWKTMLAKAPPPNPAYPHVLGPLMLGASCGRRPADEAPSDGNSEMRIVRRMLSEMDFVSFPVRQEDAWWTAHDSMIGCVAFHPMYDVPRHMAHIMSENALWGVTTEKVPTINWADGPVA